MTDGQGDEKWPPRRTATLVGHDAAEAALLQAFATGRPHHAWLISGPRGIGKATLAYRFARFLLQEKGAGQGHPVSLYVPPDSSVFKRVAAGGHPDLLTIERGSDPKGKPRTSIPIEEIRRLIEFIHRTAFEGGWRVVVVDAADDLNRNSANALLKVLEEPPRRTMLLLVCHSTGRLPATIRSRCRRIVLQSLEPTAAAQVMSEHRPDLAADDIATLARIAEGRPGYALALAEQGGLSLFRDLLRLCETFPDLDLQRMHLFAERFAGQAGQGAFEVFRALLIWWLARVARIGASRAPIHATEAVDIDPGEAALVAKLGTAAPLDRWLELWEKTGRLFDRGEALNLDRRQVALNALLSIRAIARPAKPVSRR